MYDSTKDTYAHITAVQHFMSVAIMNLSKRHQAHDASKLQSPEKEMFDEYTPLLRTLTYGSDEYKATLEKMGVALKHHYENNSHHPEHYENGLAGMSLLDLLEMFCDWQAATLRHADGNMEKSLEINQKRFGMTDQLFKIFQNTLKELW